MTYHYFLSLEQILILRNFRRRQSRCHSTGTEPLPISSVSDKDRYQTSFSYSSSFRARLRRSAHSDRSANGAFSKRGESSRRFRPRSSPPRARHLELDDDGLGGPTASVEPIPVIPVEPRPFGLRPMRADMNADVLRPSVICRRGIRPRCRARWSRSWGRRRRHPMRSGVGKPPRSEVRGSRWSRGTRLQDAAPRRPFGASVSAPASPERPAPSGL